MKPLLAILALGLCTAVSVTPLPASAAKNADSSPVLRVSKKRVAAVCRDATRSAEFKTSRRKAVKSKALSRKQTGEIATTVCRFFAASPKQQARYWDASLKTLVAQGKLTKSDRALLSKALVSPEVIASWKPTTEFGRELLANAGRNDQDNDAATSQSNSGAGAVLGGIVGAIVGGVMTGGNPAGIGAGIAVGGAVGNLAETAASGSGSSTPSTGGGSGDGDEGDSSGEEGGDSGASGDSGGGGGEGG